MALSQDAANLAGLLVALTQPDTVAIRNAEVTLKPFLKTPNSIPALFEVLSARGSQVRGTLPVAMPMFLKITA